MPAARGNNYPMHAIATVVGRLRSASEGQALVTGNGWYLTKHSAAVLAATPPAGGVADAAGPVSIDPADAGSLVVSEHVEGQGRVEAYTVLHGRDGAPARGIVLGRLAAGDRFLANTSTDRTFLEDFMREERVGAEGVVRNDDGRNFFDLA